MQVILVPHPGGERCPQRSGNNVGWPAGDQEHKRKFLRSPGLYLDGDTPRAAELSFWAEYEGPTTVVARHTAAGRSGPRITQSIDVRPGSSHGHLNTDP